jgi:hypothetical protein
MLLMLSPLFLSSVLPSGEIPYEIMIYADMCNTTSFVSFVSNLFQDSLRFWGDLLDLTGNGQQP